MVDRVLILGGRGRIGRQVAADLVQYTSAKVVITGRNLGSKSVPDLGENVEFLALDLAETENLETAIAQSNLVIHCAGPFHYRDASVLKTCIDRGVNYLDVSDHPSFTRKAIALREAAMTAGVTAIVNTGIFPGISNSMVRRDIEQLDRADTVHLSYVVSGWGRAGGGWNHRNANDFLGIAAIV